MAETANAIVAARVVRVADTANAILAARVAETATAAICKRLGHLLNH